MFSFILSLASFFSSIIYVVSAHRPFELLCKGDRQTNELVTHQSGGGSVWAVGSFILLLINFICMASRNPELKVMKTIIMVEIRKADD